MRHLITNAKLFLRHALAVLLLTAAPTLAHSAGFQESYQAATGDLNGDGLQDVYLKAETDLVLIPLDDLVIPVRKRADVAPFVLQRLPDQTFQIVSNLTSAQRAAIGGWQIAAAVVAESIDINMDGFLDLLVTGIASADPVIVFAAEQHHAPPVAAKSLGSGLRTFLYDVHRWATHPAQIVHVEDTGWYALAELAALGFTINGLPIVGDFFSSGTVPDSCVGFDCAFDPVVGWIIFIHVSYNVAQYQYPMTSQDAFELSLAFDPSLADRSVIAQSPEAIIIADILEGMFGVEIMEGVLRNGGTRDHESSADPDLEEQRGFDILSVLAAMAVSVTAVNDCRPLTAGEKQQLVLGNGMLIRNVGKVRVCNMGFMGFNGYLMAPNGHVYVGPQSGVPWREDYSISPDPSFTDRGIVTHELFHVYQVRNQGCGPGCMLFRRIISLGNYCYAPLNKPFWDHNFEQEAELVADRYMLRNNKSHLRSCNNVTTLQELQQVVPSVFK
jgi:hypothetical protein